MRCSTSRAITTITIFVSSYPVQKHIHAKILLFLEDLKAQNSLVPMLLLQILKFPPTNLQNCIKIQAKGACIGSPCAFGCTPVGVTSYLCGCPLGYQRIGQVLYFLAVTQNFTLQNYTKNDLYDNFCRATAYQLQTLWRTPIQFQIWEKIYQPIQSILFPTIKLFQRKVASPVK